MIVLIKGAGDISTGIACRLVRAKMSVVLTDIPVPTTVRRTVAFSRAVYEGEATVEGITAKLAHSPQEALTVMENGYVAVIVDPNADIIQDITVDVVVDAILAKVNLGTDKSQAPLVIGIGPGFTAPVDCNCLVETSRGHDLGRVIYDGKPLPNTGVPGDIGGYTLERLIKAPCEGVFKPICEIGDYVSKGQTVATVDGEPVCSQIDGVLRGLLQEGVIVHKGMKSGDVDPRCNPSHCLSVSDKARAISGGVLEAICAYKNASRTEYIQSKQIQCLNPEPSTPSLIRSFFGELVDAARNKEGGYFSLVVSGNMMGKKAFYQGNLPLCSKIEDVEFWKSFYDSFDFQQILPTIVESFDRNRIFVEKLEPKPKLVVLGGGHVAFYVYELGAMLGFDVSIVDDREEFCNKERFPQAASLICTPFEKALELVPQGKGVYYVIVTRGHKYDNFCVEEILKKTYSYVGMIGSRRKVGLIQESLSKKGFTPQQINSVFTPIGLPIAAQTPEEIAVSILAQIIQQKNCHGADSYSDDEALMALAKESGAVALCMITKKSGSIPRGAGSKMVVWHNGTSIGSIGGGKIEFDALNEAVARIKNGETAPVIRTFHMNGDSAEAEGMVCGGSAEVYIEVVKQQNFKTPTVE